MGFIFFIILCAAVYYVINLPEFGRFPKGDRLLRIQQSSHYEKNQFKNITPTQQIIYKNKPFYDLFFGKKKQITPLQDIPSIKIDLEKLPQTLNSLIWLGHSSYFICIEGKNILIDPVFYNASPFSFLSKPFKGSDIYKPSDMPKIDFLLITNDNYDHLEYRTIKELLPKVNQFIVPLGVGEHLEHWKVSPENIIELDWYERVKISEKIEITTLPTRHFSGRSFMSNNTLWASYMIQGQSSTIYVASDGGYDETILTDIAQQFPKIDLAILQNGQYNEMWSELHLCPKDLLRTIKILNPERILPSNHSKFALANHPWQEPLETIYEASKQENFNLLTPRIGEILHLNHPHQTFEVWWR